MGLFDFVYLYFCIISTSFIALILIYFKIFEDNSFFPITFVGSVVFFNLGLKGVFALIFFVFSSVFWGSFRRVKHPPRNYKEVLANGLIPAILSFFDYHLFLSSLAAVLSDTWSSETGLSFSKNAYSLKGLKKVKPGTEGAVSLIGTVMGALGALIFSFFSVKSSFILPIFISGFLGNILDSFLGSYLEGKVKIFTSDFINFLITAFSPLIFFIFIKLK
ncbi:MAG: DUF92 domain-containing protein [Candidatus Hydrothermales bacterium]